MAHYRLYLIGSTGHFTRAVDVECDSDERAWEAVWPLTQGRDAELWQEGRCVGVVNGPAPVGPGAPREP